MCTFGEDFAFIPVPSSLPSYLLLISATVISHYTAVELDTQADTL
jgi:hypothetical protein